MQDQKKEKKEVQFEPAPAIDTALLQLKEILTHFWACFGFN